MMKVATLLMIVPVSLFAFGTQNTQRGPGTATPTPGMMPCPMNLQGTSVAVADTATGIALSLTTKPENVTELRRRAEQMAAMHSVDRPSQAMMQGQMMPGTVKYDPIENGARLTLTPKDPAKLDEFRKQVRAQAEAMKKGECSMMQDMMQGMMHGMSGGAAPNNNPAPKPNTK